MHSVRRRGRTTAAPLAESSAVFTNCAALYDPRYKLPGAPPRWRHRPRKCNTMAVVARTNPAPATVAATSALAAAVEAAANLMATSGSSGGDGRAAAAWTSGSGSDRRAPRGLLHGSRLSQALLGSPAQDISIQV